MPPVTIRIVGIAGANSYSPNPANLQVGQQVRWRNDDNIPHTATGPGFDTGILSPGNTSAPFTFSSPGQLNYDCTIHPGLMSGTLHVTQ